MGAKECKPEKEEPQREVFYDSTLLDSILTDIQTKLRENFNILLKPWTEGATGPVLVIQDGTQDDIKKLTVRSQTLRPNQLLVALVPKVKEAPTNSGRLVLLKKSLNVSKHDAAVKTITEFIQNTGISQQEPVGTSGCQRGLEQRPRPPSDREMTRRANNESTTKLRHSGEKFVATATDFVRTDDKPALASSNTQKVSSASGCIKAVSVAFGQENPEDLLRDAMKFLENSIDLPFKVAEEISESPLLVICITNGNLTEEAKEALDRTRSGNDVMLLVATCKKDIKLDDIKAAEGFGAKHSLHWDFIKKRYRKTENQMAVKWVSNFLSRFGAEFNPKLKRTDALRHSLKSLRSPFVSGLYFTVQPMREDYEKSVVLFLEDDNIGLIKTDQPSNTTPPVLLTSSLEKANGLRSQWEDSEDVLTAVVSTLTTPKHSVGNQALDVVHLLVYDSCMEKMEHNVENKKARDKIRKFLVKRNKLGTRPSSEEKQHVVAAATRSDTPDSCGATVASLDSSSLGSSFSGDSNQKYSVYGYTERDESVLFPKT